MAYVLGEEIQLGIGVETTRGTAVSPAVWVPAKTPAAMAAVVTRATIKETRGSGMMSEAAEITLKNASGDIDVNVRNTSFGYILKSLLGTVNSTVALGATTHVFTRQTAGPQNPSLTLALAVPNEQHYAYPLTVVSDIDLNIVLNDLVTAKVMFVAAQEVAHSNYTPAFSETSDFFFRPQDVSISFATTIGGLAAATPVCIKSLSLKVSNNVKPNQCLGGVIPTDIFSLLTDITGNFVTDYQGSAAYYDIFTSSSYMAMRIKMERTDLPVLGTSTLYPKFQIDFPKVSFHGYKPDRKIDAVAGETVDIMAHYDGVTGSAVTMTLQNLKADYNS